MNNDEKFEQLYSRIVENNSEDLEISRKGAKSETIQNNIKSLIEQMVMLFAVVLYVIFYPNNIIAILVELLYIVIVIIVYKIIHRKEKTKEKKSKISQYKDEFKLKIVKSLLDSFNQSIEYFPYNGIASTTYNEAEFEKYDIYRSEDLMQGKLKNNCNFSMAEVLTEYVSRDSNGNTYFETLFCGMLTKVEISKPFKANLYLRRDRKDKNLLSRAFRAKLPFDDLRIKMDSQKFEKVFDIYCSDKIVAMQLLTADVMQLLMNFQKEMNMEYELTIKNNCIYIRFMSGKMFETAKVTKFSLDKATLYKYYKMLDFTFSLTDKLINLINDTEYNN